MPMVVEKSISILSIGGLGMAMFSLGNTKTPPSTTMIFPNLLLMTMYCFSFL